LSSLKKLLAWLIVAGALALYPWVAISWIESNPGWLVTIPWSIASAVPPLVYALLVLLCLPRSSAKQRIAGIGVLCTFHALLGILTAAFYAFIKLIPFERALTQAFLQGPPSLFLQIIWAPLALLPFRHLLLPRPRRDRPPIPQREKPRPRTKPVAPLPPGQSIWDPAPVLLQQELRAPEIAEAIPILSSPGDKDDKVEARLTSLAATEPEPALSVGGDVPERSLSIPILGEEPNLPIETWVREELVVGVEQTVSGQGPLTSAPHGENPWAEGPALMQGEEHKDQPPPQILPTGTDGIPPAEPDHTDIRIPFERIADQLPAEAFLLPLDQVASNLPEPNLLLIPQRLVLPQLPEGVVRVPWGMVAAQFPKHAVALPDEEMAQRIPNGGLLLPLDEVVRQLSPEVLHLPLRSVDVQGIEHFPAPFQSSVAVPPSPVEVPAEGLDRAQAAIPPLKSLSSRQAQELEARSPVEAPGSVEVEWSISEATEYQGATSLEAERLEVSTAEPAHLSRQFVEAQRISDILAPFGSPKVDAQVVSGVTLFTVASPRLAKEALVAAATPLVPLLTGGRGLPPVDQATLRGSGGAIVLTSLAPAGAGGSALVAEVRQKGSLALIEVLSRRVADEYRVNHPNRTTASGALASQERYASEFEGVPVSSQVERLAGSLQAFGPVIPSAIRDATDGTLLYLFLAPETTAQPLGRFARDLYRIMRVNGQSGGIGPFQSVVLRIGRQRVVVRLVAERPGKASILVTAGSGMGQPGLAHLQVERAAACLSSC
jgi:hypothetical protein